MLLRRVGDSTMRRHAKANWSDYVYKFAPDQYTLRQPSFRAFSVIIEALDVKRACVLAQLEPSTFLYRRLSGDFHMRTTRRRAASRTWMSGAYVS
jgi:hypothetical protein